MLMNNDLNKIIPKKNILTDIEERYVYSVDALNNPYVPKKFARKQKLPIICRGAGTNTVGACIPTHGGIILNFSKMNKILEINPQDMTAKVEPGVVVGDLQKEVESIGLFYPPDPSNLKVSTIGGSIALNSAGARCFKYGATKDYVIDMKVVTADGNVIRTGSNTIKNAAGYNLGSIFIGSEGTLGIVVEATLKLIPKPETAKVLMAYFDDVQDSVNTVNNIIESRLFPSTIDFMDKNAISTVEQFYHTGLITNKSCALIIEIDGTVESINSQNERILSILQDNHAEYITSSNDDKESQRIWDSRRLSMAACTRLKPNVTTDDIIVPRSNLTKLIHGIQKICLNRNLSVCLVGHVGDGGVHPQIPIDFNNKEEYNSYKIAKSEIYKLAIDLGGTISSEHGIGIEKKDYLPNVTDKNTLEYMRSIKKIFDPDNILNPYKIF